MVKYDFDSSAVEPTTSFEPLPPGKYLAVIAESQDKPTKSEDGWYLELKFQVIEGQHKGRNLWSRLNLSNPSAKAVEIARSELSAICRAVGVAKMEDSSQLHNLPLLLTVRVENRSDNGEPTNRIVGYAKKEAALGVPQAPAKNTPPWKRPDTGAAPF